MLIHQTKFYDNIKFSNSDFPFRLFKSFGFTSNPHWHINSELIYVEQGELTLHINGEPTQCSKGDIYYLPQNYLHSVFANKGCIYYVLVIGKDLLSTNNKDVLLTPIQTLISGEVNTKPIYINSCSGLQSVLLPLIKSIIKENTTADIFSPILIKTSIIHFFSQLIRSKSDLKQTDKQPVSSQLMSIKNAINYVAKNYMNKISIVSISSEFGFSPQHFSRLFKQFTGKTFIEHLTIYRLEQAKNLLIHTELPISRIPELTGFCNPCYFSRVYKKHYGISPIKNKKQLTGKLQKVKINE